MGALGDEEAEVEGGAGDALRRGFGAVGPRSAGGCRQFDAELLGGRGEAVDGVGEVAGPHPDADHMPEPVRGCAHHTERVGDVLAVGPGLHEAAGGHGGGRHGWTKPGKARAGGCRAQGLLECGAPLPPSGEQLGGSEPGALVGALVHEGAGRRERLLGQLTEAALIRDGEQRGPVRPVQMGDLMGDGPARRGGAPRPLLLAQPGGDAVELVAFLTQVVEDGRRLGHGASMAAETETIKRACMNL